MKLRPDFEQRIASLPDAQRAEADDLLAGLKKLYELNPLYRYNPLPHQAKFHAAQTKIKELAAGNRAGKTCAGIVDDLIQVCDTDSIPEPLRKYKRWDPPINMRVVAPKFDYNMEGVIFPMIREWVPRSQLLGGNWEKAFSKQRRMLYLANGGWIQFLTFEQDLDAHAGAALHRVHFDEEPEGDKGLRLYHESMARLVDRNGDFLLTLTPLFGLSWSFDEIYKKRHTERVTLVQADSRQNIHVNQQELQTFLQSLSREERQARQEGRYVHLHGMFYEEFNDTDHVADPPTALHIREQSIVVGIDPGLNRTGVVWIAFDNDNAALVFSELYPSQMVVPDVCKEIRRINKLWGVDPDYYVIDPSARNRSSVNSEALEAAYARAGIPAIRGKADRAAGILEVKRRLQFEGLVVSDECHNLINEFEHYRKDPNSQDEFAAVKKDDHLLDALRYVCLSRAWTPGLAPSTRKPEWIPGEAPSQAWLDEAGPHNSPPLGAMT